EGESHRWVDVSAADATGYIDTHRHSERPTPGNEEPVPRAEKERRRAFRTTGAGQRRHRHRNRTTTECDEDESAEEFGHTLAPESAPTLEPASLPYSQWRNVVGHPDLLGHAGAIHEAFCATPGPQHTL